MLGRVRGGLGADVVRGGLELRREPLGQPEVELDGDGGAVCPCLERRGEPLAREERRMQAARELAEILDRPLELRERAVDERLELRVARGLLAERAKREQRCGEALLGAVVQVPLEAPPLLVAGAHDPQARRPELLELRDEIAMEAVPLHRDADHRDERAEELRCLEQAAAMQHRADLPRRVLDRGHHRAGDRRRLRDETADVDVAPALPVPPVEMEARVVEDLPKRRLHLTRRREVRDRAEDAPDRVQPGICPAHPTVVARRPGFGQ